MLDPLPLAFSKLTTTRSFAGAALVLLATITGCRPEDQIQRYQVPREAPPHRMLGAIAVRGERGWFFKMSGANQLVAEQVDDFHAFIKSIRFGDEGAADPSWQLPDEWTEQPGEGMRFATIQVPTSESALELTVIPLPLPAENGILANVNRWRGQLGLSPVDRAGLDRESTTIELDEGTATVVNLVGSSSGGAPMSAPFAGGATSDADAARRAAHAAAGIEEPAAGPAASPPPASITYEAPPDWQPGQRVVSRSAFAVPREAAFEVKRGDQQAEITVTALGPAAGALLPNVNRWRAQIGLDPFTEQQLDEAAEKIDMHGVEGKYFRLIGPEQAILGVIASHGGKSWFVKLQGDHDLAVELQDQFETFTRSIEF